MRSPHVLISGASIAGPALAHWLAAAGWTTTVVERFDALRDTGQNVDVRGAGREVVRRMGLDDAVRGATPARTGTAFVDERGDGRRGLPAGGRTPTAPPPRWRSCAAIWPGLLVEQTASDVEYVFGDHITDLDDDGTRVLVGFAHGAARTFDLVVAADGIRSSTRALAWATSRWSHRLGMYTAYLTIPRTETDTAGPGGSTRPGGRSSTLRPGQRGHHPSHARVHVRVARVLERWDSAGQRDRCSAAVRRRGLGGAADPRRARRVRRLLRGDRPGAAPAGPPGGWRCSVTRPTARRRSAGWAPAWRSPGRTCWPASWPPAPTTARRSPVRVDDAAVRGPGTAASAGHAPARQPADPHRGDPAALRAAGRRRALSASGSAGCRACSPRRPTRSTCRATAR